MVKRVIGSAIRALLMAFLVVTPSLMMPGTSTDAAQMAALVGLLVAFITFFEYASDYPAFLEFRNAPPYNLLRFLALLACALCASLLMCFEARSQLDTEYGLVALAHFASQILDMPYSPVRLIALACVDLVEWLDMDLALQIASVLFVISLASGLIFVVYVRFLHWPVRKAPFNFWINLPLFDPTSGRDVLLRLRRDAHVNLSLGIVLPFLIPVSIRIWANAFDVAFLFVPEILIWVMCAWAFLPLALGMRGIALLRVAALIGEKRRRAYAEKDAFQMA